MGRECSGDVVRVHVEGRDRDWGFFNYCETAIKEDQSRGYWVTIAPEEHDDPR